MYAAAMNFKELVQMNNLKNYLWIGNDCKYIRCKLIINLKVLVIAVILIFFSKYEISAAILS